LISSVALAQVAASKADDAAMKTCVAREQARNNAGKDAAAVTCRGQLEALRLKERGPHPSSEATGNSPQTPSGKMSESGHSSNSGTTTSDPSSTNDGTKKDPPADAAHPRRGF